MVVVTPPKAGADASRFAASARAAALLRHPHIAPIVAVEEHEGAPLVVSEFVRGQSFADLMRAAAPLDALQVLRQAADLCDALAFACDHQILHRRFAPDLVIVDREGRVCLVGTGIDDRAAASGALEDVPCVVDESSLAASVGAVLYDLLATPMVQRSTPGRPRVPLTTVRADLVPAAATVVDHWVTGRSLMPLELRARDLRALAGFVPQPSAGPASPTLASLFASESVADPPSPSRHAPRVGSGLDAFTSEALLHLPADVSRPPVVRGPRTTAVASGEPAAAIEAAVDPAMIERPRSRRRTGRGYAALAAATLLMSLAGYWAFSSQRAPIKPQWSIALPHDVREPELVTTVPPEYPLAARESQTTGDVAVDVIIESDGRVGAATAVSGPAILRAAAQAALRRWRFRPAVLDGVPVASVRRFVVTFAAVPAAAASTTAAR